MGHSVGQLARSEQTDDLREREEWGLLSRGDRGLEPERIHEQRRGKNADQQNFVLELGIRGQRYSVHFIKCSFSSIIVR